MLLKSRLVFFCCLALTLSCAHVQPYGFFSGCKSLKIEEVANNTTDPEAGVILTKYLLGYVKNTNNNECTLKTTLLLLKAIPSSVGYSATDRYTTYDYNLTATVKIVLIFPDGKKRTKTITVQIPFLSKNEPIYTETVRRAVVNKLLQRLADEILYEVQNK